MRLSKFKYFDETCFDGSANAKFDFIKQSNFDQKLIKKEHSILMKNFEAFASAFRVHVRLDASLLF